MALAAGGLAAGDKAPSFKITTDGGETVSSSSLKGAPYVVYFYPKDDTSGCTKEACTIRDDYRKFQKAGAVVLGVSRQDAKSHQDFRAKYHLPFDLLVDSDGSFAKAFGVDSYPVVGYFKRQSLLIGPDGKVVRFFDAVDPAKHSAEVLALLAQLKK
jgi:thioredoxin-dependent peroxiredoxin